MYFIKKDPFSYLFFLTFFFSHFLWTHFCLSFPCPPNFARLRQFTHSPQSAAGGRVHGKQQKVFRFPGFSGLITSFLIILKIWSAEAPLPFGLQGWKAETMLTLSYCGMCMDFSKIQLMAQTENSSMFMFNLNS